MVALSNPPFQKRGLFQKIMITTIMLVGISVARTAVADTSVDSSHSDRPTEIRESRLSSTPNEAELAIAKERIKIMAEYHSQLLDTVYWALGALATVTGILVGFGWYANFRVYERDKESLREDATNRINSLHADFRQSFSQEFSELKDTVTKTLNTEGAKAQEAAREPVAKLSAQIDQLKIEFDRTITRQHIEIKLLHLERWKQKDVPLNVLSTATEIVNLGRRTDDEFVVGDALDEIVAVLESGNRPESYDERELTIAISALSNDFENRVEKIRSFLRT